VQVVVNYQQVESIFPYDPVTTERADNVRDEMAWRNGQRLGASAFSMLRLAVKINCLQHGDYADGEKHDRVVG